MRTPLVVLAMALSLGASVIPASAAVGGHGGGGGGFHGGGGGFHAGAGLHGPDGFHGDANPGGFHGDGFHDRIAGRYGYGPNLSCSYVLSPACPHVPSYGG